MQIAFVHYHARLGGVTRWLQRISAGLIARGHRVIWMLGETPQAGVAVPPGVKVTPMSQLAYSEQGIDEKTAVAALEAGGNAVDLWHFVNPFLGKNQTTPALARYLAKEGRHLVLNFHDFAEDGRVKDLIALYGTSGAGAAYPLASHVAVLCQNPRDLGVVQTAQIAAGPSMALPNPVDPPEQRITRRESREDGPPLFLYPGRMIPRKNPGEFVLRAVVNDESGAHFASTLPPHDPVAAQRLQPWTAIVEEYSLPVIFGIGRSIGFDEAMASATACLNTSLSEGFGYVFVEPWTFDVPTLGRAIPGLTRWLEEDGLNLQHLTPGFEIPGELIDIGRWRASIQQELHPLGALGFLDIESVVERRLALSCADRGIDFGRLDLANQLSIVHLTQESPELKRFLGQKNALRVCLPDVVQANAKWVCDNLTTQKVTEQLESFYRLVLEQPVGAVSLGSGRALLQLLLG